MKAHRERMVTKMKGWLEKTVANKRRAEHYKWCQIAHVLHEVSTRLLGELRPAPSMICYQCQICTTWGPHKAASRQTVRCRVRRQRYKNTAIPGRWDKDEQGPLADPGAVSHIVRSFVRPQKINNLALWKSQLPPKWNKWLSTASVPELYEHQPVPVSVPLDQKQWQYS